MVFGSTLRLLGEFFSGEDTTEVFTSEFRPFMQAIKLIPDTNHDVTRPFVHPDLASCSHVFSVYNELVPNKLGGEESKTITTLRLKPAFSSNSDNNQALDSGDANSGNRISACDEITEELSGNDWNIFEKFDCNSNCTVNKILP
ncbi:hypothetical protein TKK_0013956 [Trichogramma kaykai]